MSSQEIISHFLQKSMIKWKLFKENPTLPWKFSRCSSCSTPLFSQKFSMCCLCSYQWDQDMLAQERRMEEEDEFIEHPCRNCGRDGGDDGPVRGFCSRLCLREWTRD